MAAEGQVRSALEESRRLRGRITLLVDDRTGRKLLLFFPSFMNFDAGQGGGSEVEHHRRTCGLRGKRHRNRVRVQHAFAAAEGSRGGHVLTESSSPDHRYES